jgi:hypothetical protein
MSGSLDRDIGVKLQSSLLHVGLAPSRVNCIAALYIQLYSTSVKVFSSILPGIFDPVLDAITVRKVSE